MNGHALLLGLMHEPPIVAVRRELVAMGAPHTVLDQRRLLLGTVHTSWSAAGSGGYVELDGHTLSLDEVSGVYTRLTTWSSLPEVRDDPARLALAQSMHDALEGWLETASARVINRTSANETNNSKPYQALIIRDHFDVPATLVTNDPDAVLAFRAEVGDMIYKSVSGERSIVSRFDAADVARLVHLDAGPVQFQEYVRGTDVRVHVVGSEVLACAVKSAAVDYRYDGSGEAEFIPVSVPDEIAEACVALTARLGLELSGIDLRFADEGRVVCFEVNPSPAYTVFEEAAGLPIARAIARRLIA